MALIIEAEARLRAKNQITLPEPVVSALEAKLDDRLVFEADVTEPGVFRVRLLPRSFAGALTGVYGTTAEVKSFLRDEHADWESIPEATQQRLERAIPPGERILLDTTCLAAYLDTTEVVHPVAGHVLDAFVASGRNPAVVAMVTVMEIIVPAPPFESGRTPDRALIHPPSPQP